MNLNDTESLCWLLFEQIKFGIQPLNLFVDMEVPSSFKSDAIFTSAKSALSFLDSLMDVKWSSYFHSPIWNNPLIKIQNSTVSWHIWQKCGIWSIKHICKCPSWLSFPELVTYKLSISQQFRWLQLTHCLRKAFPKLETLQDLPDLLTFTNKLSTLRSKGVASSWYTFIQLKQVAIQPVNSSKWFDLQFIADDDSWLKIWTHCFKSLKSSSLLQSMYFLVHRATWTPVLSNKINANLPSTCWSCGTYTGTLVHLLFYCPLLQSYWASVWRTISDIFSIQTDIDYSLILFGNFEGIHMHDYYEAQLFRILTALALQNILYNWKNLAMLNITCGGTLYV
uniref:Uncharacterized protein LOC117352127 n=1 Tax=Geotrypetes seraphini TaxID=260995 RepID=A0A6P8PJU8_GEOSA|nr:uncharacterized protein LOC117352127 [Geotrypetes seraphini]XP_033784169.1 uncharacterized protein LOC117352127 [Geotrypetes seraphini]XP_033784170.1 uncharacterized protein LOC117352127 [Geotrypetes seraphini]